MSGKGVEPIWPNHDVESNEPNHGRVVWGQEGEVYYQDHPLVGCGVGKLVNGLVSQLLLTWHACGQVI